MGQSDSNLFFTGGITGAAQAITSAAVRSTGILDLATGLMNIGTTYAAAPLTIGNASVFAEDLGIGALRLMLAIYLGAAFVGGTSLNIAFQGAVDAAAGAYPANLSGLTWNTYAESGAQATAGLLLNAKFPMPDWPHRAIAQSMPRFVSLLYTPVGTFSAGTIANAYMTTDRGDNPVGLYPSGFTVGA